MKKTLVKLIAICLSVICAFGLIACDKGDGGDNLSKAQYATAFGSATGTCKNYMATAQPSVASAYAVEESDLLPYAETGAIYATIWFMDFLKNVCETDSFTLTDGYTECDIAGLNSNGGTENYKIRFDMQYNKSTNTIDSTVYCQDFTNGNIMFLDFEVVYDFNDNSLTSFVMQGSMGYSTTQQSAMYLTYTGGELKSLDYNTQAYLTVSVAMLSEIETHYAITFGENLPDYSEQYNSANPYLSAA